MRLAKEKGDLTWLHKPEYKMLFEIWRSERAPGGQWTTREDEYGFRRPCCADMGINAE